MDQIARKISFGVGRVNETKIDHDLFDDPDWAVYQAIGKQEHDKLKGRWLGINWEPSEAGIILWICLRKRQPGVYGLRIILAAGGLVIKLQAGS